MPHRPPAFISTSSKGGEVYPQAPPSFIDSWPSYTGTIGAVLLKEKQKRQPKEKDFCWAKIHHLTESL